MIALLLFTVIALAAIAQTLRAVHLDGYGLSGARLPRSHDYEAAAVRLR